MPSDRNGCSLAQNGKTSIALGPGGSEVTQMVTGRPGLNLAMIGISSTSSFLSFPTVKFKRLVLPSP